jgi:hypothetical protein
LGSKSKECLVMRNRLYLVSARVTVHGPRVTPV